MSDSTRFFAKKELNRACGNLSWALKHILRVKREADKQNPILSGKLDGIASNLLTEYTKVDELNKSI